MWLCMISKTTTPIPLKRLNANPVTVNGGQRFVVTRVGVFRDDLAYHDRRGVYIIKDNTTGKEFVGVSGVGISELGVIAQANLLFRMSDNGYQKARHHRDIY